MWTLLLLLLAPVDLGWLAGTWLQRGDDGQVVEERWSPPVGGNLVGTGRTVRAGRVLGNEFLQIEVRDDGTWYRAQPGGRCPPTDFKLVEHGPALAVFTAPAHDFPQRIAYRREGDHLHVTLDGVEGGQPRHLELHFTRAP
ncbi:MAG: hypothetical protein KC549_18740 [Myxococcales bacterium]|nr:hypothetical protein [Myxococcales bacterium]MCB9549145.1 hypothetical protein [Myxococcales bacterium]